MHLATLDVMGKTWPDAATLGVKPQPEHFEHDYREPIARGRTFDFATLSAHCTTNRACRCSPPTWRAGSSRRLCASSSTRLRCRVRRHAARARRGRQGAVLRRPPPRMTASLSDGADGLALREAPRRGHRRARRGRRSSRARRDRGRGAAAPAWSRRNFYDSSQPRRSSGDEQNPAFSNEQMKFVATASIVRDLGVKGGVGTMERPPRARGDGEVPNRGRRVRRVQSSRRVSARGRGI